MHPDPQDTSAESTSTRGKLFPGAGGKLLGNLAHDLRTPLNSILGFAGTLLMELPGPLNRDQKEQLQTIEQSAGCLLGMINDLFDVARIELGLLERKPEIFDGLELLEEVAVALKQAAGSCQVQLQSPQSNSAFPICTDRRLFSKILLALAYTLLKVAAQRTIIFGVSQQSNGEKCWLRFEVTGTEGMPDSARRSRILGLLHREDHGRRDRLRGEDLELYLANELAQFLNGFVEFHQGPGTECGFTFTLEGL